MLPNVRVLLPNVRVLLRWHEGTALAHVPMPFCGCQPVSFSRCSAASAVRLHSGPQPWASSSACSIDGGPHRHNLHKLRRSKEPP
jgi:hypothetical protein